MPNNDSPGYAKNWSAAIMSAADCFDHCTGGAGKIRSIQNESQKLGSGIPCTIKDIWADR